MPSIFQSLLFYCIISNLLTIDILRYRTSFNEVADPDEIDRPEEPFGISIEEIKLIRAQRHKAIELMALFNECLHLTSRARSSDDAPKSFRASPLARFRATTRTILSPFPPSLLPAS